MRSVGAVVIGGYINGLGLVRALAARGVPVAVITTQPYDIAQHSRFVVASESIPDLDRRPEALPDLLRRRAGDWRGWGLIPSTDDALAAIASYQDEIASGHKIIAPSPDAVSILLDKDRMLRAAQAAGIKVPHCYGPASQSILTRDIRFPVVVKPIVGYRFFQHFGSKLFRAADPATLDQSIARVEAAGIPCQVFDQIPGSDDLIYVYCTYFNQHGEPCRGVTIRKIRQSPPFFGVARVAEVVPEIPELREATIELSRRIGLRGMAVAEFKLDERDGTFRFMEINGRSVIYNGLLRQAGLDLAGLAWAEHMNGQGEQSSPNGWPGTWINLHADLLYSLLRRRDDPVSWGDFISPYTRPMIEAVWSSRDVRPFFAQWSRTLREAIRSTRPASR